MSADSKPTTDESDNNIAYEDDTTVPEGEDYPTPSAVDAFIDAMGKPELWDGIGSLGGGNPKWDVPLGGAGGHGAAPNRPPGEVGYGSYSQQRPGGGYARPADNYSHPHQARKHASAAGPTVEEFDDDLEAWDSDLQRRAGPVRKLKDLYDDRIHEAPVNRFGGGWGGATNTTGKPTKNVKFHNAFATGSNWDDDDYEDAKTDSDAATVRDVAELTAAVDVVQDEVSDIGIKLNKLTAALGNATAGIGAININTTKVVKMLGGEPVEAKPANGAPSTDERLETLERVARRNEANVHIMAQYIAECLQITVQNDVTVKRLTLQIQHLATALGHPPPDDLESQIPPARVVRGAPSAPAQAPPPSHPYAREL